MAGGDKAEKGLGVGGKRPGKNCVVPGACPDLMKKVKYKGETKGEIMEITEKKFSSFKIGCPFEGGGVEGASMWP